MLVTYPNGKPAAGVPLALIESRQGAFSAPVHGATEADGTFTQWFAPAAGAQVKVVPNWPVAGNQRHFMPSSTTVDLVNRDQNVKFVEPLCELTVLVVGSNGQPVRGIRVEFVASVNGARFPPVSGTTGAGRPPRPRRRRPLPHDVL